MDMEETELGEKIKYYREAIGWSQRDLAKKTNMSNDYISKIETGKVSNIGIEKFLLIASALNRKPDDFLKKIEEDNSPKLYKNYFGSNVRLIALYKDIDTKDIASQLNIPLKHLNTILDGDYTPPEDVVNSIASFIRVSADKLFNLPAHEILGIDRDEILNLERRQDYIPITVLSELDEGFFDKKCNPLKSIFCLLERTIKIDDEHAYVVDVDIEFHPLFDLRTQLYVSPSTEVEDHDLVLAIHSDRAYIGKVHFQDNLVLINHIQPNIPPIAKPKKEYRFIHKIVLIQPPQKRISKESKANPVYFRYNRNM